MRIVAHLIVKNEQRDLPRCLKSLVGVVDAVVIADTGSTDDTWVVAQKTCGDLKIPLFIGKFTSASEQDEHGDWLLWDFSKARNAALQWTARFKPDWLLWMDADDELLTPDALR